MVAVCTPPHSALAFYGLNPANDTIEKCYCTAIRWMTGRGLAPTFMCTDLDKDKLISHSRSETKLRKKGFTGTVRFDLVAAPAQSKGDLEARSSEIYYSGEKDFTLLVISFASRTVSLNSADLLTIASEACALTRPSYGIAYERPLHRGPVHYAMCISRKRLEEFYRQTEADREESMRISRWSQADEDKLYLRGSIRDVYPRSFLNPSHLNFPIENATFAEWVRRDPHNGTLSPFTEALTLWEVSDEEIPRLQHVLFDAGMVYDYERDTLSKLPPGPPMTPEEALQSTLEGFGMSAADVDVLKVEAPGKTRKLSDEEVKKITGKKKPRK